MKWMGNLYTDENNEEKKKIEKEKEKKNLYEVSSELVYPISHAYTYKCLLR